MTATSKANLLIVDDDETFRTVLARELSRRHYSVSTAADGASAVQRLRGGEVDVALLDLNLPDIDGIALLKQVRAEGLHTEIVMITGHGTIDTAVQAIRLGAYDYVAKPFPVDELEMMLQKVLERRSLLKRNQILSDGLIASAADQDFIGASKEFRSILDTVGKVAGTDSTVLILGETGVGKGMVAKMIHNRSRRDRFPFVVVDCGAFHENLLNSELFGHEKGAFTGAVRLRHGLFEVADKGTIFLDEIGEVGLSMQANLLRVLETGQFRRLGSEKETTVSVRIVAASNRRLQDLVQKGHFREDLYFRLNRIQIDIPPLRERADDIPLLVDHFVNRMNERYGQHKRFTEDAVRALQDYAWPGNVRQLISVVDRSFVLCDNTVIGPENLFLPSPPVSAPPTGVGDEQRLLSLAEVERAYIQSVLKHVHGHRAHAAEILHISLRNLYRLIKTFNLDSNVESADAESQPPTD